MTESKTEAALQEPDISWLLSPVDREAFVDKYWATRPLRINREEPGYYSRLLPDREMEFALHLATRVSGAELLTEDDVPQRCRSHEQAIEGFRSGKSLRINAIQRFSYPIMMLCRSLEQSISCPISVNMYLTPGAGKKALTRHFDTHDVFVLQIHGSKKWRLYDPPSPFPLEYLPLQRHESVKEMTRTRLRTDMSGGKDCILSDEFTMKAGDCLYLPRGFWHEAEGEPNEISCHLTIGIQATTYLDVLNVALAQWALSDLSLRWPLPFGFAMDSSAAHVVATKVAEIIKSLPNSLNLQTALGEVSANLPSMRKIGFENHLLRRLDSDPAEELNSDCQVRVKKGVMCGINSGVSPAQIMFGSKSFAISPAYEDACRFIAREPLFTPAELPGDLEVSEKLTLVRQLISEGLLSVSTGPRNRARAPMSDSRWLPVHLAPKNRMIEWLNFGDRGLTEPFLHQSAMRFRREVPSARTRITRLDRLPSIDTDISPSGFIFHISRCGSTLLSNGLRALQGTIVVSEPQPINGALMLLASAATTVMEGAHGGADTDKLLRYLVQAYGQRTRETESALVVKFSSWNILHIARIRRLWPQVPCVIIVRDPAEVAVSCLEHPPGWMHWKENREAVNTLLDMGVDDLITMSDPSYCAKMIGTFLQSIPAELEERCCVIDYTDLDASAVEAVAQLFGISVTVEGRNAIRNSTSTYSKDPAKGFKDDRESKQSKVTAELRGEIDRWAKVPYQLARAATLAK